MPAHKVWFGVGLGAWNGADVASTAESVRLVARALTFAGRGLGPAGDGWFGAGRGRNPDGIRPGAGG